MLRIQLNLGKNSGAPFVVLFVGLSVIEGRKSHTESNWSSFLRERTAFLTRRFLGAARYGIINPGVKASDISLKRVILPR